MLCDHHVDVALKCRFLQPGEQMRYEGEGSGTWKSGVGGRTSSRKISSRKGLLLHCGGRPVSAMSVGGVEVPGEAAGRERGVNRWTLESGRVWALRGVGEQETELKVQERAGNVLEGDPWARREGTRGRTLPGFCAMGGMGDRVPR